jgi:putative endopeptidase
VNKLFDKFGLPAPRFSIPRFEEELMVKMPDKHDLQSTLKCFNPIHEIDLNRDLVWIKWYLLPHKIERLSVDSIAYFKSIGKMMQKLSIARWQTYLIFQWLHHVADWFSDTYLLFFKEIEMKLMGKLKMPLLEYHLVEQASLAWWQDAGEQFVASDKKYLTEGKKLVESMAIDIRDTLHAIFAQTDWDAPTKDEAQQKLANMEFLIGWSEHALPRTPELPSEATFDTLMLEGWKYQYRLQLLNYGKPTDHKQWRWVGYNEVNAFYSRELNTLFIPASLFYPPFLFLSSEPEKIAENFGGMGSIIAHEVYHGFDYDSKAVNASGTLSNWWTHKDHNQYMTNAKKIIKLYSVRRDISGYRHINGRLTLSENIADLVSLRLAWQAFLLRWVFKYNEGPSREVAHRFFVMFVVTQAQIYSPEVVKFILKHDNHATAMARVNLPLSMFTPFLDLYNVKPGDAMYTPRHEWPDFLPIMDQPQIPTKSR